MSDEESRKKIFYSFANAVGHVEKKHLEFGSQGLGGGIDGAMCASTFYFVLKSISRDFLMDDPLAYGCDIGHGTGFAAMAYFNYFIGLNMVGIEFNKHRSFCSWTFQRAMLLHRTRSDFREIAKKSQFYLGEGAAGLKEVFGTTERLEHLRLLYWFREGWSPKDIIACIDYANLMMENLEWFLCDMSQEKLEEYGFKGMILSTVHFTGRMKQSTNSRTIYIHKVRMPKESSADPICASQKERIILEKFDTKNFSLIDSIDQELLRHDMLFDRSQRFGRASRAEETEPLSIEACFATITNVARKRTTVKLKKETKPEALVESSETVTKAYLQRLFLDISLGSKVRDESTATKTALLADKREKKRKLDLFLSEEVKMYKFRPILGSP